MEAVPCFSSGERRLEPKCPHLRPPRPETTPPQGKTALRPRCGAATPLPRQGAARRRDAQPPPNPRQRPRRGGRPGGLVHRPTLRSPQRTLSARPTRSPSARWPDPHASGGRVAPDRLEEPVAHCRLGFVGHHQRLRDELVHDVHHVHSVNVGRRADDFRGFQCEPADKHAEPAQNCLSRGIEQVVAPIDRRLKVRWRAIVLRPPPARRRNR